MKTSCGTTVTEERTIPGRQLPVEIDQNATWKTNQRATLRITQDTTWRTDRTTNTREPLVGQNESSSNNNNNAQRSSKLMGGCYARGLTFAMPGKTCPANISLNADTNKTCPANISLNADTNKA